MSVNNPGNPWRQPRSLFGLSVRRGLDFEAILVTKILRSHVVGVRRRDETTVKLGHRRENEWV